MWRHVLPALVERGYRAVAPDLRGIGQTSRPTRIGDYRLRILGDDVAALIEALGERKADLVGHDWGGLIAWETAFAHPEVVDRLITVSGPAAQSRCADGEPASAGWDKRRGSVTSACARYFGGRCLDRTSVTRLIASASSNWSVSTSFVMERVPSSRTPL